MLKKLATLQQPDGSWHSALLDPAHFDAPETSGTAFFTYGLLWAINNGLVDRETYLPHGQAGWERLNKNIQPDGRLGYVQPVGADPQAALPEQTHSYGVGGFLMAATEMHNCVLLQGSRKASFSYNNDTDKPVLNQMAELSVADAEALLPGLNLDKLAIRDAQSGQFVRTQLQDKDGDGKADLISYQVICLPKARKSYELLKLTGELPRF